MRRLDREAAKKIITERVCMPIPQLAAGSPLTIDFTYSPIGGTRITDDELGTLRRELLEIARSHGYPASVERTSELEARMGETLHRALPITPHEASQEDAWTYLTCCWLLDVAVWRFGADADERRFIGNVNRNTFRRLWWRREVLGAEVPLDRLGEDELVSIMERPTIASDRRLARGIATRFLAVVDAEDGVERMHLMREAMKRLMRLTPFLSFYALGDDELEAVVSTAFESSNAALKGVEAKAPKAANSIAPEPSPAVVQLERKDLEVDGPRPSEGDDARADVDDISGVPAAAIAIARRTGRVTNASLREATAVSPEEARDAFNLLMDAGVLARRGVRRGTHYVIAKPTEDESSASDGLAPQDRNDASPQDRAPLDTGEGEASDESPPRAAVPERTPSRRSSDAGLVHAAARRLDEVGALARSALDAQRGRRTRASQALEVLRKSPGMSIPELAKRMNMRRGYLYRIMPGLEREGKVTRQGSRWYVR
jgi:DNA-binding Lrp family transcriptional regulator